MITQLENAKRVNSAAFVLARDDKDITQDARLLGPGWADVISIWESSGLAYLVAVAPDIGRLRQIAPVMLPARDQAELLDGVFRVCNQLAGRTCTWIIAKPVRDSVLRIVLPDCGQAGNA